MTRKILRIVFFILFLFATIFIFANSMRTSEQSSLSSSFFVTIASSLFDRLGRESPENLSYLIRKLAHFTEFAVQAGLLSVFFMLGKKRFPERMIYVLFAGLFTACCDEFTQLFYDGRGSQVSDVFIDFSGCFTAVMLCLLVWALFLRRRRA